MIIGICFLAERHQIVITNSNSTAVPPVREHPDKSYINHQFSCEGMIYVDYTYWIINKAVMSRVEHTQSIEQLEINQLTESTAELSNPIVHLINVALN